ncbi:MbnP family protein [Flavobacterium tegetincola]|uniref:MbnP family protein n=1 Tax=Flavobacterium tegetincola TaxID=150172 RepID=UPI0012F86C20|nr:MbnP family protein [Flavobacterium tegetincola]
MHLKTLLLFGLLWTSLSVFSQTKSDSLLVHVQFQFDGANLKLNSTYISKQNDTLTFDKIKMYLSKPQLIYKNDLMDEKENPYHLIDIEKPKSQQFSINNTSKKKITGLKFNIGVDSLASVSGAMEGALDATNGMYWAWQSGFINFKIEGKSSSCLTRKNKFQFHVGGYSEPYYAMREMSIIFNEKSIKNNEITIQVDLAKLFSEIRLSETNAIMIPGKEAMKIADIAKNMFSVQ